MYRNKHPDGRIIAMTSAPNDESSGRADVIILGLDGPLLLRRAIEQQLRFAC
jgi:hypothetical protein